MTELHQEKRKASGLPLFRTYTQGGRLTGADIHAYIVQQFNKHYHTDFIYYLLDQMGFSWITSRSKHPKQCQATQEAFKKLPTGNDP
ncbi:winged helix-turn-helix domain-containing protein [Photobacterium sp. GJ3]|nr:winged helix-turn-helix domain-containing protein [Photobacterium sp. GJ3]